MEFPLWWVCRGLSCRHSRNISTSGPRSHFYGVFHLMMSEINWINLILLFFLSLIILSHHLTTQKRIVENMADLSFELQNTRETRIEEVNMMSQNNSLQLSFFLTFLSLLLFHFSSLSKDLLARKRGERSREEQ